MAQGYKQDLHRHLRQWLQHVHALDNLLTLFGLERQSNVFGDGFIIFHPSNPGVTRWIAATASEESWLEDVKLLAKATQHGP